MLTYEQGCALLAKARDHDAKPLCRNTTLLRLRPGLLGIRYVNTVVVEIHGDGSYVLHSGGWRTRTTKAKMLRYAGAGVQQSKGVWYVGDEPYYDGFVIKG